VAKKILLKKAKIKEVTKEMVGKITNNAIPFWGSNFIVSPLVKESSRRWKTST